MIAKLAIGLLIACVGGEDEEQAKERILFRFEGQSAAREWQTVNDGVMGGRSRGQYQITDQKLKFSGTLSLANNGGFASVRSRPKELDLENGDKLVLRVKGDGRVYTLNLYEPTRRTAFSYRVEFQTVADEWRVIEVPLDRFQATWFGRTVNERLDPERVTGVGILLGDKKPGEFELLVDWIKVVSSPE